jgi:hypothetical protein
LIDGGDSVDRQAAVLVLAETVFMVRDYVKQNRHSTQVQRNTNKLLQSIGKRL